MRGRERTAKANSRAIKLTFISTNHENFAVVFHGKHRALISRKSARFEFGEIKAKIARGQNVTNSRNIRESRAKAELSSSSSSSQERIKALSCFSEIALIRRRIVLFALCLSAPPFFLEPRVISRDARRCHRWIKVNQFE